MGSVTEYSYKYNYSWPDADTFQYQEWWNKKWVSADDETQATTVPASNASAAARPPAANGPPQITTVNPAYIGAIGGIG